MKTQYFLAYLGCLFLTSHFPYLFYKFPQKIYLLSIIFLPTVYRKTQTYSLCSRSRDGFSMFFWKASSHVAANSSSTILRSQDSVTVITLWIVSSVVNVGRVPPTAIIQAWGGLITAENSVIPYIPRLEMVKEPPWNSCSCNLPSLARLARSWFGKKKLTLN